MNRTTNPTALEDKVADTASNLSDSASTAARDLSDAAAKEAARVGDMVRGWIERQSDHARLTASMVRDEAVAAKRRTERYVADEPMKSVLIAAAAGALITGVVLYATRRRTH
jgi:ElaB/YqjD/DUF883 family membrane-anchored ribosome-binding protein